MKSRTPIVPVIEQAMKRNPAVVAGRRTEITIEREVLSAYYEPGSSYRGLCPECRTEVLMVTAEAASVTMGGDTPRDLPRH